MPLKIGIYDPYLDTLGGGERYLLTVAEILLSKGHQVDILWSKDQTLTKQAQDRFSLNLSKLNLVKDIFSQPTSNIDLISQKEHLEKLSSVPKQLSPSLFQKIKQLKQRITFTKKYDVFFYLGDGSLPFLFSKKNILHIQMPPFKTASKLKKLLDFFKLKKMNQVICNSKFTQKAFQQTFRQPSVILYPPIDIEKFDHSTHKNNIILSVGRFDNILNRKRQDILIEAFKLLHNNQPSRDWKLILAGGSIITPSLNNYLKHLKYQARDFPIEFIVKPKFSQLQKLYSQSKIYWHAAGFGIDENKNPQNTEHFGMTVVEAMASGVVPVVLNKGGLPETIQDKKSGFLWRDTKELVAKSQLLIASPKLLKQISQQAIDQSKKFSKQNFASQLLKIIND